ncbi:uncharacterized protein [Prorops nasuta]|uniref:uncharacterized protein isoform X1 n=1 Tax=Prorops nasuta TaxID=863751 RepID=UPI0034CEE216
MPDSGAVYQPTTVGYSYDTGGDATAGSGNFRNALVRLMSRHKITIRKWSEWVLLSISICFFVTGLTTMLVNLISTDNEQYDVAERGEENSTLPTKVDEHIDESKGSIALGAGMMLIGFLLGFTWIWLRFFHRGKSTRGGITGSGGQMLGGLNPSTDLLVGSTSQYGPVLTELPTQIKLKQASSHDVTSVPLSDQEEETRTLMQDSAVPLNTAQGSIISDNQVST